MSPEARAPGAESALPQPRPAGHHGISCGHTLLRRARTGLEASAVPLAEPDVLVKNVKRKPCKTVISRKYGCLSEQRMNPPFVPLT